MLSKFIGMSKKVRVRFAPSPTGALHIGGVRTALFNYLFAKKHNGDFVLRIEDTDQNRFVEGAEEYIEESLEWCGIPYDEGPSNAGDFGPYRQSERKDMYSEYALELVAKGKAYYAFDTPEELDHLRKNAEADGNTFVYNSKNRGQLRNAISMDKSEVDSLIDQGVPYVIRFKTPVGERLILKDIIRGTIEIDSDTLDDKILFKSDGMPTYHLANVVDDHLMQISHVIRGEEWLPSLALHYQLYDAFGWEPPQFAHLPLLLKPTGKGKLSKRDGEKMGFPVFPLAWEKSLGFREEGYYPEAVVNFLAFLGWNPGDEREIFSLSELVDTFDLNRVQKAGARFDPDKTKWYNHHYLQQRSEKLLLEELRSFAKIEPAQFDDAYVLRVISLVKERADFVSDIWDQGAFFFIAPEEYDEKAAKKHWKEDSPAILTEVQAILKAQEEFSSMALEKAVKKWIEDNGIGFGKVMAPLRLAVVGALQGPHLFDILAVLGKEESLLRIQNAIDRL